MPVLSLCEPHRLTTSATVEPLEENIRDLPPLNERHALKNGEPLLKTWIECSVCQKRMQASIFCSSCSEEASHLILEAYRTVNKKELAE